MIEARDFRCAHMETKGHSGHVYFEWTFTDMKHPVDVVTMHTTEAGDYVIDAVYTLVMNKK